ncbi:large subunit ribosomal protein L24 [Mariprofundus micogutta]|uniref:Large ribosomal subunit protein uL24 n=1 Tax=Mariprofundus micogutta TaxID=1921010 RepID=A0A1L8CR37_9PROT|nr:50S ribosomal protein L24 [Mariprofundus micogutta]GAV21395.1 large subunit ribosomal protein L24 [Mariprofundus micogutta]
MTTVVKSRIRRDDDVIVTAGRDKGSRGKVIRVMASDGQVLVSKINMIKRHTRQSQASAGGIIEKEAPLAISNVQYYCSKCKSGVRLGAKTLEDGSKVRTCRKCGEVLDK